MVEYKLLKKKEINGKKRNIYKKKGSIKQYIKYKCKMMNLAKYKKMKTKKLPKKRNLSRKTKKRGGGPEVLKKFYNYSTPIQAHILLRGIEDSKYKNYRWRQQVDTENEALIPLEINHVKLIKKYIPDTKFEDMVLRYGKNIKINITDMPKSGEDYKPLERTSRRFRRGDIVNPGSPVMQPGSVPGSPVMQPGSVHVTETVIQGDPITYISTGNGMSKIDFNEQYKQCTCKDDEGKIVKTCRVLTNTGYKSLEGKCDSVPNKCIVNARDTIALRAFDENPNATSVQISSPKSRDMRRVYMRKGGKKRKVKKSVKTKKFK